MQREMEELRTNLNKRIEAVEEEPGTQSGDLVKLVDHLTIERVGQLERRMQVAEEEMEHKFADITNKNTANKTSLQKIQGDIKTLTSNIEKEPKTPTGDSNMNQLKQELGQANEKINKLEQSIKQLQDNLEEDFPPIQGRLNKFEYTVGRLEQRIEEVAKEARKSLEESKKCQSEFIGYLLNVFSQVFHLSQSYEDFRNLLSRSIIEEVNSFNEYLRNNNLIPKR